MILGSKGEQNLETRTMYTNRLKQEVLVEAYFLLLLIRALAFLIAFILFSCSISSTRCSSVRRIDR